jgi:hypothetical protein
VCVCVCVRERERARLTTPGYARVPMMACVLPLPVCPYANTVPLMPSMADCITWYKTKPCKSIAELVYPRSLPANFFMYRCGLDFNRPLKSLTRSIG